MMKADLMADHALGAAGLGGAAGILIQHLFFPEADGKFLGAVAGAVAMAALCLYLSRPTSSKPTWLRIESRRPSAEPLAALSTVPMVAAGVGYVAGELAERLFLAPVDHPILGTAFAVLIFPVALFVQGRPANIDEDQLQESPSTLTATQKLAEFTHGVVPAMGIGTALGDILDHFLKTKSDLHFWGLATGMLGYAVWAAVFFQRRR